MVTIRQTPALNKLPKFSPTTKFYIIQMKQLLLSKAVTMYLHSIAKEAIAKLRFIKITFMQTHACVTMCPPPAVMQKFGQTQVWRDSSLANRHWWHQAGLVNFI